MRGDEGTQLLSLSHTRGLKVCEACICGVYVTAEEKGRWAVTEMYRMTSFDGMISH